MARDFVTGLLPDGPAPAGQEPSACDPSRGPTEKPAVKAYAVSDPDGERTEIVFATRNIVARRVGASRLDYEGIGGLYCRRLKWADKYATDGRVPASICVARGWWFEECCGCGRRIDEDELAERRLSWRSVIGFANGGRLYCCKTCKDRDERQERRCERVGAEFMGKMRAILRRRFPDAIPGREHVYVPRREAPLVVEQARIEFEWPGQKIGPAAIVLEEMRWAPRGGRLYGPQLVSFQCCMGDKEAFEAYARRAKDGSGEAGETGTGSTRQGDSLIGESRGAHE